MLRLTLTVLPGGDERRAHEIGRVEIVNIGWHGTDSDYRAVVVADRAEPRLARGSVDLRHLAHDGAWRLVQRALAELLGPTRGELINAEATAGARVVEAREALAKAKPEAREKMRLRLLLAETEHAIARAELEGVA